jgi:hypothetical protein
MNHLLVAIKDLFPNLAGLQENIIEDFGNIVGYKSIFYTTDGKAIGGGTSENKDLARRIAVAESLERGLYRKLSLDPILRKKFKLETVDSTLGFACGFEREKTAYRSFCEGIEKWALSKVIDDKLSLIKVFPKITAPIALKLLRNFQELHFYQKKITTLLPIDNRPIDLVFTLFVGCTEQGAFPGSQVVSIKEDQFSHSIIEAARNFENFKQNNGSEKNILDQRLNYFGYNKQFALNQIKYNENDIWPNLQVDLFQEYSTEIKDTYLYRTLMKNFIPVSEGTFSRFII